MPSDGIELLTNVNCERVGVSPPRRHTANAGGSWLARRTECAKRCRTSNQNTNRVARAWPRPSRRTPLGPQIYLSKREEQEVMRIHPQEKDKRRSLMLSTKISRT